MNINLAKRWIYIITGFTQTQATRTRMVELWKTIHDMKSDSGTVVQLKPWNAKWNDEAELIFWMSVPLPEVLIFAYSWGAGWGFVKLSEELSKKGLSVRTAVLSDPVYRHWYWAGQWRAFFKDWSIKIPPNVGEVFSYYQRENWPCGHTLKAVSKNTVVHNPVQVVAYHQSMDDCPEFLQKCNEVCQAF